MEQKEKFKKQRKPRGKDEKEKLKRRTLMCI